MIRRLKIASLLLLLFTVTQAHAEFTFAVPKAQTSPDAAALSEPGVQLVEMPLALSDGDLPIAKIVGGTTTSPGEFPEFVQLWVDGAAVGADPNLVYAFCGASLISSNKVLTAAHCTLNYNASDLYAFPGFYSFNDDFSFADFIPVSSKTLHPDYSQSTFDSDVAILTLSGNSNTAKASVYGGSDQLSGDLATVIGTGLLSEGGAGPTTLQKVSIPIVSNTVCKGSYGNAAITDHMLCAGLSGGGQDSCSGDSGGPLWVTVNGTKTQAGVVSWGVGCAQPNFYGVYARTSSLVSFIIQNAPGATVVTDSATPPPLPPLPIEPENNAIVTPLIFLLLGSP